MKNKLSYVIILLIILFSIYIIFYYKPKSYSINYTYNKKFYIYESYNKNNRLYKISVKHNKNTYNFNIDMKYKPERKLIKRIIYKDNCLTITSNFFEDQSLCINNNEYETTFYDEKLINNIIDTYNNIDIYNYDNNIYYIWAYNGFIIINENKNKKIELFDNDSYNIDVVTKLKDYLLVADYNQKYYFEKMYMIKSDTLKLSEITLNNKIYFNSYILGTNKNNIYIYDFQKKQEYKFNPFKEKLEKINNKILVNNKWNEISDNKLQKKEYYFKNDKKFEFYIDKKQLLYKSDSDIIKVANLEVDRIIESTEEYCYFISKDTLYKVNIHTGITALLKYSEWEFNNKNIYIF